MNQSASVNRPRLRTALGWIVMGFVIVQPQTGSEPANLFTRPVESPRFGALPMSFEVNQGQFDQQVKFFSRGRGYGLFLTPSEAVIVLKEKPRARPSLLPVRLSRSASSTVRVRLIGADRKSAMEGLNPLPGKANYFLGSRPRRWRTDVPLFARVAYRGVYPKTDLIFYGNEGRLEFDFVVAPGGDSRRIHLRFAGVKGLRIDPAGDLVLSTSTGELRQHRPKVYQVKDGSIQEILGGYRLRGKNDVMFEVAPYDPTEPLVIDPVLTYASYLGGTGRDVPGAIALDASGNVYLAGTTDSRNFPVSRGVLSETNGGECDVFVTKFTSAGALSYSTYLGGSECEEAYAIAVDSQGNAYVTGATESTDFPIVNALQSSNRGGLEYRLDAFVAKLNSNGSQLLYSTYLGGTVEDYGQAIAVDNQQNAYVAGFTGSSNFPTSAAAYQTIKPGYASGFLTKLGSSGATFLYSTFLGGSTADAALSVAVDPSGYAYVAGLSRSSDFPTTAGVLQPQNRGESDLFVVKMNPTGSDVVWSSLLGGTGDDLAYACAIDPLGSVYVTGSTDSLDFPLTPNAVQKQNGGYRDAFLAKFNASGTSLLFSTYLGGMSSEEAYAISLDLTGSVYIGGDTYSSNFPTVAPFQANLQKFDCFVVKLDTMAGSLRQATFLGGSDDEYGCRMVARKADSVYVAGQTYSDDFPVTQNAFQSTGGLGGRDAFLAALDLSTAATLAAFPARLEFLGAVNTSIPSDSLSLTAAGEVPVNWAIEVTTISGGNWLKVSPRTGSGSAIVEVAVETTGRQADSYSGLIKVTTQDSGGILAAIPVKLRLVERVTSVSAASFTAGAALAPESIASAFGQGLATGTEVAASLPLPDTLAGRRVSVTDSTGTRRRAPLFFVSPGQINYLVPEGTGIGPATVTVYSVEGTVAIGTVQIAAVAPSLFTANQNGQGAPAALAVLVKPDGTQSWQLTFPQGCSPGGCTATPIDLGAETDQVFLQLYGTGIRGRSSLSAVSAKIGGVDGPVAYAGPAPGFVGLDQVNVGIPRTLFGRGDVDVVLSADGITANTVKVNIR